VRLIARSHSDYAILENGEEKEYNPITMSTTVKNQIRREVLQYLKGHTAPVKINNMAEELRQEGKLSGVRDSDVRAVVQPMIVTGKISYTPNLKIKLG
jgi:hypothetical protein